MNITTLDDSQDTIRTLGCSGKVGRYRARVWNSGHLDAIHRRSAGAAAARERITP